MRTGRQVPFRFAVALSILAGLAAADEPPPPLNAKYALSGGSAPPGGALEIVLSMRADAGIQGYSYSIDFDEEVLEALGSEVIWQKPDGTPYAFLVNEMNNENATPGSGGVDEGFVIGAAVFDLERPSAMPADVETDAVRFRFRVRPETAALTTELQFIDGGDGRGAPVPNRLSANGYNVYTRDSASSFIFISGFVGVVPDILTFVRGDSNGDEKIDISDPRRTLNYLFLGMGPPACYDAADANDDGVIDIADPVFTLGYLFSGEGELPPPHPEAGADPTPDSMGCLYVGT